jgi:hypothetical protein
MADKQIVSFKMDLNKPPPVDDSLAIVPILEQPQPLAVIPLKDHGLTGSPTLLKCASRCFLHCWSVYF